jgi:hypothetical protein
MTGLSVDDTLSALAERLDQLDRQAVLSYAAENELQLLLSEEGFDLPGAAVERERLDVLRDELGPIVESFETHRVPAAVIKFPRLEKPLSDIDVLIDPDAPIARALTEIGYVQEDDTEPHRRTYVREREGERIAVDVHLALSWRRVRYLDAGALLAGTVTREIAGYPVPVPSPAHELAVTAAHSVFKHNQISMFDVLHAIDVYERHGVDDASVRALADEANWGPQFDRFWSTVADIGGGLVAGANGRRDPLSLPIEFPLSTAASLRGRKLVNDAMDGRFATVGVESFAYTMDMTQFTVEDRLGVSMKPFFDLLSWLKRRGRA